MYTNACCVHNTACVCRCVCVAVCCSVLQCVAVCCTMLACCSVLCAQHYVNFDLQCVAVCCSVLQCVAVQQILSSCTQRPVVCTTLCQLWLFLWMSSKRTIGSGSFKKEPMMCKFSERNTSPRVLIRINTLQHTATHCNTLQHTATHCDTHTHTHQHTHDTSPRGGFVFTMFPDQEPCVRGPPSKDLYQVFRGGSSSTRLLIREHSKHKTPPRGGVSFD